MDGKIKIHKGLDIPIGGAAERRTSDMRLIKTYGIQPSDFVGLTPRLEVHEGDLVEVGQTVVSDKNNPKIRLTSPVCGTVKEIRRGERRAIEAVVIEKSEEQKAWHRDTASLQSREGLIEAMMDCGLWPMMRQRPFGTIANPDDKPRDIFISLFDSAPLAPCPDWAVTGHRSQVTGHYLFEGLNALSLLTDGKVHVCGRKVQGSRFKVQGTDNIIFHEVSGPHPAGNIGTQIAAIAPINKGERVWTMNPHDVVTLGQLVATGDYRPERLVAVTGPAAAHPQYYRIIPDASLNELLAGQVANAEYPRLAGGGQQAAGSGTRVISGNVLSGRKASLEGFLGAYDSQVTLIEEGDSYDFMGWLMPGLRKHSFSRTFLSGLMPKSDRNIVTRDQIQVTSHRSQVTGHRSLITYNFNTNLHGGVRPLMFSGNFERVFPFDIYPTQLIKAAIIGDIDLMEQLGIYEVEPEDFALCEYIDPSKTEIQTIIRNALELCRKESV